MKKKISIAIDGPSAAGKSTIAKMVAKKENFIYIDTGAMYRSVAFYCIKNHIDLNDEQAVEQAISNIQIRLTADNKVYLNDEDVSLQIRTDEVSLGASCVSKYQAVRTWECYFRWKRYWNSCFTTCRFKNLSNSKCRNTCEETLFRK